MGETRNDTHRMIKVISLLTVMTIFVLVGFGVLYYYTGEPKITFDAEVFFFNLVGLAIISSIVVIVANVVIAGRVVAYEENLSNLASLIIIVVETGLLSGGVSFPAFYAMSVVALFVFLAKSNFCLLEKNISFPTARVVN